MDPKSPLPDHIMIRTPPRKFGTLLSVNSPQPTKSSVKKARVVRKQPLPVLQDAPSASTTKVTTSYHSVTFPAGPIGLQLETHNGACRIQNLVPNGAAERLQQIQVGDVVTQVNGTMVQSYEHALALLKANAPREILLMRTASTAQQDESNVVNPDVVAAAATAAAAPNAAVNKSTTKAIIVPGSLRRFRLPTTPPSLENSFSTTGMSNETEQSPCTTTKNHHQNDIHDTNELLRLSLHEAQSTVEVQKQTIQSLMLKQQQLHEPLMPPNVNEEWQTQRAQLESQLSTAHKRLAEQDSLLEVLGLEANAEIDGLHAQIRQLHLQVAEAQQEAVQAQKTVQQTSRERHRSVETLQHQLDEALRSLEGQSLQLHTANREVMQLRSTAVSASQVEMLRQENQKLRELVDQTKQELIKANAQVAQAGARVSRLEDVKNKLEQELHQSQTLFKPDRTNEAALEAAEATIEELRTSLASTNSALEKAVAEKRSYADNISRLSAIIEESTEERSRLQHKLSMAQKTVDSGSTEAMAARRALRAEIESLQEATAAKDETLANATKTIEGLRREVRELEHEIFQQRRDAQDVKRDESKLRLKLDKAAADLVEERNEAQRQKEAFMQQVALLESSVLENEKVTSVKQTLLAQSELKLEVAESECRKLAEDLRQSERLVNEANSKVRELERNQEDFLHREKRRHDELEEQVTVKFQEASYISNAKLTDAHNQIVELTTEVRALEALKRTWTREIERLEKANRDLQLKVDQYQKAMEEKEVLVATKSVEGSATASLLEDARSDLVQKSRELEAARRLLETVQAQNARLKESLCQLTEQSLAEKESIASEMLALQESLADSTSRHDELERIMRAIRRSAVESDSRLSQTKEQLEREYRRSRKEKEALEASITALSERLESSLRDVKSANALCVETQLERDSLQSMVATLGTKVDCLENELERAQSEKDHNTQMLQAENSNLALELHKESARAASLYEELLSIKSKTTQIEKKLEDARLDYDERIKHLNDDYESKVRSLEDNLRGRILDSSKLSRLEDESKRARRETSTLQELLQSAKDDREKLSAELIEMRHELSRGMEATAMQHDLEAARLRNEKSHLESLIKSLEHRLAASEDRLHYSEDELFVIRSERDRLVQEKRGLVSALNAERHNVLELRQQLDDIQSSDVSTSSSDDGLETGLGGLSRSDLKAKCRGLERELHAAMSRNAASTTYDRQREEHLKQLEADLRLLSHEIDQLVQTNETFEDRFRVLKDLKDEAETKFSSAETQLSFQIERVNTLERELAEERHLRASLHDKLHTLETEVRRNEGENTTRETMLKSEVIALEQRVRAANKHSQKTAIELETTAETLKTATARIVELETLASCLDTELAVEKEQLKQSTENLDSIRLAFREASSEHAQQISSLREDCESYRIRCTELEVEIKVIRGELENKEAAERFLSEQLDVQNEETLAAERLREDLVAKFSNASRVVANQKDMVATLEQRAMEAESSAASLASKYAQLTETLQNIQSRSARAGDSQFEQIQALEEKCKSLEEECSSSWELAESLREQVREAKRNETQLEKSKDALQNRLDSAKAALEASRAELVQAMSTAEEASHSSGKLASDLESKKMEADHLKAKMQLLNATVARLKSDQILLKEAALQAEFRVASSGQQNSDVLRLEQELKAKTSKLESLSEVYRSQQQVLALSQTLEERLLHFIEDVIQQVDSVFSTLGSNAFMKAAFIGHTQRKPQLNALDLAGMEKSSVSSPVTASLWSELHSIIPSVLSDLEAKRKQLSAWKQQRTNRVQPGLSTPDAKRRPFIPDTPSMMDALNRIKHTLNEEVLSPVKDKRLSSNLDSEYFRKVIQSLEVQIDSLLDDLRSANEALQAKDQLFSDLDHLVSHHELERDRLEKKLESKNGQLREMDDRLKREIAWKRAAEKEAAKAKFDLKNAIAATPAVILNDMSEQKKAAGRLIANFVERRAQFQVASSFRHWACQSCANRAVDQQRHTAMELAHQLDSTREKLGMLKNHLKKRRTPGLGRIVEGYETT